jgi:hypothetical protein
MLESSGTGRYLHNLKPPVPVFHYFESTSTGVSLFERSGTCFCVLQYRYFSDAMPVLLAAPVFRLLNIKIHVSVVYGKCSKER